MAIVEMEILNNSTKSFYRHIFQYQSVKAVLFHEILHLVQHISFDFIYSVNEIQQTTLKTS